MLKTSLRPFRNWVDKVCTPKKTYLLKLSCWCHGSDTECAHKSKFGKFLVFHLNQCPVLYDHPPPTVFTCTDQTALGRERRVVWRAAGG